MVIPLVSIEVCIINQPVMAYPSIEESALLNFVKYQPYGELHSVKSLER